ncbi:MAG: acetyltransferase [Chlorobi bacterium]|nr:acetyltransferase [Chlorobiota bacterium]
MEITKRENIFLFGAGPHCNVVIDIVESEKKYNIAGIIDSVKETESPFNDYKIIGRQENIKKLSEKYNVNKGIICLGDNFLRSKLAEQIKLLESDFEFVNAIHPSVIIGKNVKIGAGNVIMPGVVINTYAEIKNHCIINTNSSLEHNCVMNDFTSLSAGVTTGGYVEIKKYASIALGVTLFDRIQIGEHTIIGSGAIVTKSIPSLCVAYGVPAKIIRPRKIGEKYLK